MLSWFFHESDMMTTHVLSAVFRRVNNFACFSVGPIGSNSPCKIKTGVTIEDGSIEIWNNKIFLTAKVNGKPFRFILDTGSPTILTTKVANELGLEILSENTSQDANGNLVKTNLSAYL